MKNFESKYLQNVVSFFMNKIKILIGKEENVINFFNGLRNHYYKISFSERMKEGNINNYFLLEGLNINQKEYMLLEFVDCFDLVSEYKLGTKAIMTKFFETYIESIKYDETLNTINILLNDFFNSIQEGLKEEGLEITVNSFELNKKTILQNLSYSFSKDDCSTNQMDYSYKEILQIQKNIFKFLIKNNSNIKFILLLDRYIDGIEDLIKENVLIFTKEKISTKLEDYYLIDINVDCADENQLYDLFLDDKRAYDFASFKEELLSNFLNN